METDWETRYEHIVHQTVKSLGYFSPEQRKPIVNGVKQEIADLLLGFRDMNGRRVKLNPLISTAAARDFFRSLNEGLRSEQ